MHRWIALVTLVVMLPTAAIGAEPGYRVETVAEGLEHPWSLAFLPDGGMLVTERAGRLRLVEDGVLRREPVAGVPAVFVSGQAGLFEVALDPDFESNRILYLSYAYGGPGANHLRVARARWNGEALESVDPIFTSWPAKTGDAHYGGRITFLPDGSLAIGTGDGFVYREHGQKLDSHLGKVVRIHGDGSVPDDNPFVGHEDALPEIYSWGHRNVQGIVHDDRNGVLYAHEHGPRGGDELNRIVAGDNYGWPLLTGGVDYNGARITPFDTYPGMTSALLEWTPSIAPSGMALYRGGLFPEWENSLFVSALAGRHVQRIPLTGSGPGVAERLFGELDVRIRDVRAGPDGALYLLTDDAEGRLLRVVP